MGFCISRAQHLATKRVELKCFKLLAGSGWCRCFAKLPLNAQAVPATICVEVVEVFLQSGAFKSFGTDRIRRRFWMFLGEIVGLLSEVMVFLPGSRCAFC